MAVWLHSNDYPSLKIFKKRIFKNWISNSIKRTGKSLGTINVIFLSDEDLLKINHDYLNHDYFTDVITFDFSENFTISGDIYISVDRVIENSILENSNFNEEALRVVIHGVLHLIGFGDSSDSEKRIMRQNEDLLLETVKDRIIFSF